MQCETNKRQVNNKPWSHPIIAHFTMGWPFALFHYAALIACLRSCPGPAWSSASVELCQQSIVLRLSSVSMYLRNVIRYLEKERAGQRKCDVH